MTDPLDALERLARLRDQGVLSDEEFAAEKARILKGLAHPGDPSGTAANRLGNLLRGIGPLRWIPAGIAAALAGGAVLAFFVWSDIENASTREPKADSGKQKVAAKSAPIVASSLATTIRFQDSAACAPSEGFGEIIAQMKAAASAQNAATDSPIRLLGVEEAIFPEVRRSEGGSEPMTLVRIAIEGDWNGLHLSAVKTATWGENDVSTLQLVFDEPAEQARSMLRQLGFKVGRVGELSAIDPDTGGYAMIGVEALEDGSAITCARDGRARDAPDETTSS